MKMDLKIIIVAAILFVLQLVMAYGIAYVVTLGNPGYRIVMDLFTVIGIIYANIIAAKHYSKEG